MTNSLARFTLAKPGRTTSWVKIQCNAAKMCIVRSNLGRRPSVKGALQLGKSLRNYNQKKDER